MDYAVAEPREQVPHRRENPDKLDVVRELLARHADEPALVIGQYLEQLDADAARARTCPLITGKHAAARARRALRATSAPGAVRVLAVSKVANFAIDLPDATVADPGLRHLRLAAGGGAAARPHPAPQAAARTRRTSTRW